MTGTDLTTFRLDFWNFTDGHQLQVNHDRLQLLCIQLTSNYCLSKWNKITQSAMKFYINS